MVKYDKKTEGGAIMKKENGGIPWKSPHVFIILILLVMLASLLTYIVPAGKYQYKENKQTRQMVVVADSYRSIKQNPLPIWKIPEAMVTAVTTGSIPVLILFILVVGGSFGIIMDSGAIQMACEWIVRALKSHRKWVIPIFVCFFSVFGFTMGLATASIIFVPMGILISKALGFDTKTGMAMIMLGTNAGFAAGVFNPFSVGIAQDMADLPIFSGAWLRWLILAVLLFATSLYILRKAEFNGNQEENMVSLWDEIFTKKAEKEKKINKSAVLALLCFVMILLGVGVSNWGWEIRQLTIVFLLWGILSGIFAGDSPNEICRLFVDGSKKVMTGIFVIGLAATMRYILEQGMIIDSITYGLVNRLKELPPVLQLSGMFFANAAIDPFITSGSAHASVMMPLMVPLADGLHLSRQSAVLAFQLGDGLVNLVSPISTTLTSCLALTGLSYEKWLKYYLPLVGWYLLIGEGFIILAGLIGY